MRDYVHVRDITHAHLLALQHIENKLPSDIFNIGSGSGITITEIIKNAQTIMNQNITITYDIARVGDPAILVSDITKTKRILQWQCTYSDSTFILQSVLSFADASNRR